MGKTRVQLKRGCFHGSLNQHQPGDILYWTDVEIAAFGDKVTILGDEVTPTETAVPEPVAHPLDGLTARDIIAGLQDGTLDAAEVVAYELSSSKPRKSVLKEAGYNEES